MSANEEQEKKEETPLATSQTPVQKADEAKKEEKVNAENAQKTAESSVQEQKTTAPTKRRMNWAGFALDSFLVLALVGTLAGGGYYLKQELDKYRVPSIMEITMTENLELCKQREALQAKAYHADEQIHMRKLLSRLERQLGDFSRQLAEKEQDITAEHNKVLALQHEIRQADKEARNVARSLLPGMPIGNATTTSGKAFRDAVIFRMEGKLITLRSPEGQVRFPANQLVKETLPTLARYAFDQEDLIDMSDFEVSPMDAAAARQRAAKKPARDAEAQKKEDKKAVSVNEKNYEPAAGAPVVDTAANRTTTTDAPDDAEAPQEVDPWADAPGEELPF